MISLRLLTQLPLVCRWFLVTLKILYFLFKAVFPLSREDSWYYCFLICSQKIVMKQTWASHEWYSWAHVCISLGAVFCVVGVLLLRTGLPISFEAHCWSQRRDRDPWWLRRVCVTSLLWSLPCPGPLQEYSLLAPTHHLLVKVPITLMVGISSRKEAFLCGYLHVCDYASQAVTKNLLWQMVLLTFYHFFLYLCPLHIFTESSLQEHLGTFEMWSVFASGGSWTGSLFFSVSSPCVTISPLWSCTRCFVF